MSELKKTSVFAAWPLVYAAAFSGFYAAMLLALFALYFFGGEVIAGFVFAMIFGVIVGTYSSIFIAVALLLEMRIRRGDEGGAAPNAEIEAPSA